jgi:hypothetical protein
MVSFGEFCRSLPEYNYASYYQSFIHRTQVQLTELDPEIVQKPYRIPIRKEDYFDPNLTDFENNIRSILAEKSLEDMESWNVLNQIIGCNKYFDRYSCKTDSCSTNTKENWIHKFRFFKHRCKSRYCLSCSKIKKGIDFTKYENFIKSFKNFNFLTLTFKNVDFVNKEYVQKTKLYINNYLKTLKRKYGLVVGAYIKAIDVKQTNSRGYHLHYHILLEVLEDKSNLIPLFRELLLKYGNTKEHPFSKEWLNETGDSFIVNFTPIKGGHADAMTYTLGYLKKIEFESPKAFVDYIANTKSLQFIAPSKRFKKLVKHLICDYCKNRMAFDSRFNEIEIPDYNLFHQEISCKALSNKYPIEPLKLPVEDLLVDNDNKLLEAIKEFLGIKNNAFLVESTLNKEEIEFLLKRGDIYEPSPGTYQVL